MSSISPISHAGFSAIAAGIRGQIQARTLSGVLEATDLLDPDLAVALNAIVDTSQSLVAAGVAVTQNELLGQLVDAVA